MAAGKFAAGGIAVFEQGRAYFLPRAPPPSGARSIANDREAASATQRNHLPTTVDARATSLMTCVCAPNCAAHFTREPSSTASKRESFHQHRLDPAQQPG